MIVGFLGVVLIQLGVGPAKTGLVPEVWILIVMRLWLG